MSAIPAKARLEFDPPSVTVPVNQKAELRLMLVGRTWTKAARRRPCGNAMLGPDVAYSIAQPDAVRFDPPVIDRPEPATPPFQVSGSIPMLSAANAKVEVVDNVAKKLRIVPSAASPLAAGQPVALKVEQQVGDDLPSPSGRGAGGEGWKEVRPDAVTWSGTELGGLDAAD